MTTTKAVLIQQVATHWRQAKNTAEIARVLGREESEIDQVLPRARALAGIRRRRATCTACGNNLDSLSAIMRKRLCEDCNG